SVEQRILGREIELYQVTGRLTGDAEPLEVAVCEYGPQSAGWIHRCRVGPRRDGEPDTGRPPRVGAEPVGIAEHARGVDDGAARPCLPDPVAIPCTVLLRDPEPGRWAAVATRLRRVLHDAAEHDLLVRQHFLHIRPCYAIS